MTDPSPSPEPQSDSPSTQSVSGTSASPPPSPSDPGGLARRRAVVEGTTISAAVLIALAIYGMVNYLSMRHYTRFDWTSAQLYSLSEKSTTIVGQLDRDIDFIVLLDPTSEVFTATDELLDRYIAANPERLRRRDLDPARDQLELKQLIDRYDISRDNVLVVASETDQRIIGEYDLAKLDYSGAQYGQPTTIAEYEGEQQITSAILSLVEDQKPKVVVTTGHGEAPFDPALDRDGSRPLGRAFEILIKDNFELESWASLGAESVPADADLLVIAGPTSRFLPPELELLSDYVDRGGRLMIFLDPVFGPDQNRLVELGLEEWLAEYGIEAGNDVVIDPDGAVPFYGAETFYSGAYGQHPVVEGLAQTGTPVIWSLGRSIGLDDFSAGTGVVLSSTSESGWAETSPADAPAEPSEGELRGPVPVAVALGLPIDDDREEASGAESAAMDADSVQDADPQSTDDGQEARLVVFGDLDFATDLQLAGGGNAVLLLNAFNWLVEREQLIEIEPRRPTKTRLSVEQDELLFIYIFALLLLPGFAVTAGVWMALRRRR